MAPSPTGHLHIGTARTAIFNYLFARKHNGTFILRTEDTDKERSKKEFEDEITDGLAWLGIKWDSFYRQSERTLIYTGYLNTTIEKGSAYVSKEESKMRPGEMVEVVRLKNPNKVISFTDEIRGEISFDTTELGDFVIARSITDPLYHFTVVVDDHEMEVTHVIRGEDHISNTPRQILIQEAIGALRPQYAHLPLILAPDRSKLSKRHGAVMLSDYKHQGFIQPALINYLTLLGWNPGTDQEFFTLDELINAFDLSGVQKGGAIFDVEKLKWFNKEHVSGFSDTDYYDYVTKYITPALLALPQFSTDRLLRLLPTIKERTAAGAEITLECEKGEYDFAFQTPKIEPQMVKWKNDASPKVTLQRLQKLAEIISLMDESFSIDEIKNRIWGYATDAGKGEVLWPLRVSLTGKERSPDPFTVIHIIGPSEAYTRIKRACDTILSDSLA